MAKIVHDGSLSELRNSMRRSVERTRVRKSLMEMIEEATDDICERYGIGGGGDGKASK